MVDVPRFAAGDEPDDALADLIDRRWDPEVSLLRITPGAAPALADRADRLHVIRESALAALHWLDRGAGDDRRRAQDTIAAVLANQFPVDATAWAGTFRVVAEQATPGADAAEWIDYDPNWRQFVGLILAIIVDRHAAALPKGLVTDMTAAVGRCVAGEPADRIPRWYTNPNLMHAWLQAWVGRRNDDPALVEAGDARAGAIMERFDTYGDVDEYNSPTYDGIDLIAAGLWVASAPTDRFADHGARLLAGLGARISATYHPGLRAAAGPYVRTYGFGLDRHVSLMGLWWSLAGERGVLPPVLDTTTDHIHDLHFLPLCRALAPTVLPLLVAQLPTEPRTHAQAFRTAEAVTQLSADSALGAWRGHRSPFSRDQFAPLVTHWSCPLATAWLGLMLGAATHVDATLVGRRNADVVLIAAFPGSGADLSIRLIGSDAPSVDGPVVTLDRSTLIFDRTPDVVETHRANGGHERRLRFSGRDDQPVSAIFELD